MSEGAFYQSKSMSPTALAVVLLMHGAAITALAMAKMEVIGPIKIPRTIVDLLEDEKDPPPVPPEPVVQDKAPRQIDTPPRAVQLTAAGPVVEQARPRPVELDPLPRVEEVLPPADPPKPPVKKIEPARARANLASYVSDADYPASAIRAGQQGTTRFRLGVGPDGRVTECAVTSSSGSPTLDAATCRLMKSRARFVPARDSDGKATGDTAASAIRWVLPDR